MILSGRHEEALAYFEGMDKTKDANFISIGGQAVAYACLGNSNRVAYFMDILNAALGTETYGSAHYFILMVRAQLGTKEEVFELMREGLKDRKSLMFTIFNEPLLSKYHQEKEFVELRNSLLTGSYEFGFEAKKYKKSFFNPAEMEKGKSSLQALMEKEEPYLDPKLSLRSLAEGMDFHSNYLSQLLNEGFNKNFSEFINGYRVEKFKMLVKDESKKHFTLLALAYESGFNSKTVFNTYFKKNMGMTPKAYWNSVYKG